MGSRQDLLERTGVGPRWTASEGCAVETVPDAASVEKARCRVYALLGALFSHPDTGKWGRVLNGDEQRRDIATADSLRVWSRDMVYPILPGEFAGSELNLRSLVIELCQPLEHLKGEYDAFSASAGLGLAVRHSPWIIRRRSRLTFVASCWRIWQPPTGLSDSPRETNSPFEPIISVTSSSSCTG